MTFIPFDVRGGVENVHYVSTRSISRFPTRTFMLLLYIHFLSGTFYGRKADLILNVLYVPYVRPEPGDATMASERHTTILSIIIFATGAEMGARRWRVFGGGACAGRLRTVAVTVDTDTGCATGSCVGWAMPPDKGDLGQPDIQSRTWEES